MEKNNYTCTAEVGADHTLTVHLPSSLPVGPVALEVRFLDVESPSKSNPASMSAFLKDLFQRIPVSPREELEAGFAARHDEVIRQQVMDENGKGLR